MRAGSASRATASAATAKRTRRAPRATIRAPKPPSSRRRQRPGGDGLRVGEPQPRQRELVRLLVARQGGEDRRAARCAARGRARAPRRRPAARRCPSASPQRSSESGSSSTSWSSTIALVLGPIARVGEVQRQRAALQLDRFRRWCYHCAGQYTVRCPRMHTSTTSAPASRSDSRWCCPRCAGGISFGVLAQPVMGSVAPVVMSLFVFSGAAQFAALTVLADGRRSAGRDPRRDAAERALAADGARHRPVPEGRTAAARRSSRSRSSTPRSRSPAAATAPTTASGSSARRAPVRGVDRPAR